MFASKVIKLYSTFNSKDKKSLLKFAHSPYHNQHKDVARLVDYLSTLKKITPENVDRKLIHKEVFKNKKYNESNIRHISSYLFKVLEAFIVYEEINKNELEKFKILNKYYRENGVQNILESNIKRYFKLDKTLKRDSQYYQYNYLILNEIYQAKQNIDREKESNLEELVHNLDIYYITEKLKQTSNVLAHNSIYNKDLELSLIDPILNYIEEKQLYKMPLIAVHYYNYFMVKEPKNESYFEKFMDTLNANTTAFESSELRDLYILGINYNLKKANKGDKTYPKKVFELYKSGLKNKALLPFNTLSSITYRNIINTALYLEEHKWAKNFIHEYKEYLEDEVQEDTFNFNLAHYYSKIEDYTSSLRILATLDFNDEIYSGRAKILQLKMYYESEEFEVLESFLDSFWIYLKRKKHLGYHRDIWLKVIKYTKAILHTKIGDDARLLKIRAKIIEEPQLMEKEWLCTKIDDLLK